jgi:diadenosine tetraphosphate (Ap4A) HIT family hydrolase
MSDSRTSDCPFCCLPAERIIDSNAHALAIRDAFPVSPGHTLIIVRRHDAGFFDLSPEEWAAVYELLQRMKGLLDSSHRPAGYNVGVNVGQVAGQTIMHLHFHLIPRYSGDMHDPSGGIRNVLHGEGPYVRRGARKAAQLLPSPGTG